MPSAPQATSSSAVGGAAEAALEPGAEDRQADRDDEQVADVDVGEGGGQVAPPLVPDRDDQAAEGRERVAGRLLDQEQAAPSRGSRRASRRAGRRLRAQGEPRAKSAAGGGAAGGCASSASPRRSSFGARLRSRAPQYGHSVTYGLTSEPQFLQMTLSSVSLMVIEDNPPAPEPPAAIADGILPSTPVFEEEITVELKSLTEQKSLLATLAARQTGPPAPAAVRVRSRQRNADAAADRPGHRARPARLLPQPGLEGPRLPVPARRRGRLLGPRLPDRHGREVLPRLRRPGAADPQGQRQDRHPLLGQGLLHLQRQRRGRACGSAPTRSATRSTSARRARTRTSPSCARCARTATASACRWSSGPTRAAKRSTAKGGAELLLRDRLRGADGDGDGRRHRQAQHAEDRPGEGQGRPGSLQRDGGRPGGGDPPVRRVGRPRAGRPLRRLQGRRRDGAAATPAR